MSASSPDPDDVAGELPISVEEAQAISDALKPLQDVGDVGSSIGRVMESSPGAGPKLVGAVLQHGAIQAELASVSIETLAQAIQFYADAQTQAAQELFPPPHVLAAQIKGDFEPITGALDDSLSSARGDPPQL